MLPNSHRNSTLDGTLERASRGVAAPRALGHASVPPGFKRSTSAPALEQDRPETTEEVVDVGADIEDTLACSITSQDRRELRRASTDIPLRNRPWRKKKTEVIAERAEAERILQIGSAAAGAAGIDVRGLLFCMVAQECLDASTVPADNFAAAQAAVDSLRQTSTNAALKEDVDASRSAVTAALQDIGLADDLKSRLKRPSIGKYDNCDMVLPGLWIGGWTALNNDAEELRRHKVTHVVSVMSTEQRTELPSFIRGHHHITADDKEDAAADLSVHFPAVCRFVDAARSEPRGCVYIHCGIGVSRAPTVTASYIMWKLGLPAAAALDVIRQARPKIRPNLGFVKQLRQWEVDMLQLPGGGHLTFNEQPDRQESNDTTTASGTESTSASSDFVVPHARSD